MDFNVDTSTCVKCGLCAAACPVNAIRAGGIPSYRNDTDIACVSCGHCVAVCPRRALSAGGIRPEDCIPVNKDLAASKEQISHIIRSRRSIRAFINEPVSRDNIEQLIDIARCSPTASNSQLIGWTVVSGQEKIRDLAELTAKHFRDQAEKRGTPNRWSTILPDLEKGVDRIFRGAPALIIAHAPESYRFASVDGAIAITGIDLSAPSYGLGTCWAGIFMAALGENSGLRTEAGIPEGRICAGALMIGVPAEKYGFIPPRKKAPVVWK
jgi:nitroreductase/NAD-dependent dihydropyrimidine dehydrogenase PreA subunit